MSFFRKIQTALGFNEGEEWIEEAVEVQEEQQQADAADNEADSGDVSQTPIVVDGLFARVLEIFNQNLPDFIANSVDPKKQERLIYDSLDESVKRKLQHLEISVHAKCEQMWAQERKRLQEEADRLKKHAEHLEEKRQELSDQRLSSDRQKRALADRVRDLETQVMTLEAEKEQYEIENKCMVNKTKATAVLESELEDLRQENAQLRQALKEGGGEIVEASSPQDKELIENLNAEIAQLKEALEAASVKDKMNDSMFADFQKRAAEAGKEASEAQAEIENLQKQIEIKDSQIADLQKDLVDKENWGSDTGVSQEELEEIQQQIEQFEGIKHRMDAQIAKLKASLKESQKENETLRTTIKNNLSQSSAEAKALKAEIAQLRQQLAVKPRAAAEPAPAPKPVIDLDHAEANVDDVLSGTDWLVSIPEKDASMRDLIDETDFGYQAPQKKQRQENDSQLSLFDF